MEKWRTERKVLGMTFLKEASAVSKKALQVKAEVSLDGENSNYFTLARQGTVDMKIEPDQGTTREGVKVPVIKFSSSGAKGGSLVLDMTVALTPENAAYFTDILEKPCTVSCLLEEGQQELDMGPEQQALPIEDDGEGLDVEME